MTTNSPVSSPPATPAPPAKASSPLQTFVSLLSLACAAVLIIVLLNRRASAPAPAVSPAPVEPTSAHRAFLDVTATAPDFTLQDAHGENAFLTLSAVTAKKPVLLIYYLGYSCPRCIANLQMIADRKDELDKLGIQVIAVGPNTVTELRDSISTYEDLPFPMLSDPNGKVAAAYDLKFGDRLLHGIFLIDQQRQIRFAQQSSHPYDNYETLMNLCKALHDSP